MSAVLYSYRRCPYAMRARMALHYALGGPAGADITLETREISLRDKPAAMLAISPKATVPVLQLDDGTVLEQSLDIMHWALARHDPDDWALRGAPALQAPAAALVAANDGEFKQALDRYKYPERYPQQSQADYRAQGELVLQRLEQALQSQRYLLRATPCYADIAIFPFVRQFAAVDPAWFHSAPYAALRPWLQEWLDSALFAAIMHKQPVWQP